MLRIHSYSPLYFTPKGKDFMGRFFMVFAPLYSLRWVFKLVGMAFQSFSPSHEVLVFMVCCAIYFKCSLQNSSLPILQFIKHFMFGLYIFIGFTFNISYSFVASNILTIAGNKCSDTMCFTTSSQHTMAGSHCDSTSSFTSSLQHICVGGRTLGAYK